ncbi:MAG: AI-2E family transporter, partial [Cyanobacteria bacterium P01_A01_bin.105]
MIDDSKGMLDRLNNLTLVRFLLLFASGWAGLQLLRYFEIVVVVFASSAILAFLLGYPVRWCRRLMPHSLAVTLVFLLGLVGVGGVVGGIAIAVVTQGPGLTASIGDFFSALPPTLAQFEATLQQWNLQVDLQTLGDQLRDQAVGLLGAGFSLLQSLLENFV